MSWARRLAIDQLRVALSRPTERLIWVDVAPDPETVREVGEMLRMRGESGSPAHDAGGFAARRFAEEELDVEESIQRCQKDARQFVDVKPDLAWSRAQQAVALLGLQGMRSRSRTRRRAPRPIWRWPKCVFSWPSAARRLSAELGRPDLYAQAAEAARER